ncbi:uncharacterized protein TNCV_3293211 [Trichonephila clavipes]|nr:uncharacterized protein TNCV_3293211 [Trichonephila clavipes]
MAKKQRLCFLCLRVGCTASKCKAKPCKLCARRHHVSLHFSKQNTNFRTSHNKSNAFHPSTESRLNADARVFNPTAFPPEEVSEKDSNAVFAINQEKGSTSVLLSSVKYFVKDSYGEKRKIRGLLDDESNYEEIRRKIRIKKRKSESRDIALKRLNALWTRLIRDPQYLKLYRDFIHEYEQLGHMKEVVVENDNSEIAYYMPHHAILRPEKSTTKLRKVFNATNPTSNRLSLNSIQYNGGLVQNDLFTIMIKFREHPYAFTADVKMMYRMILIHESQQPLLRILWKESPEDPVKTFEMKTVTYGTALKNQLSGILKKGGMELHKWGSSHLELASNIIGDYEFENPIETKTLGVPWKSQEDCFIFKIAVELKDSYTKRSVLSTTARLFDPLGLLGPVVARAKIFMQSLWNFKIDELPSERVEEWHRFLEDFNSVSSICIGRCIVHPQATRVELNGFADASGKCYGAVIYCRSQSPDGATVKLVTSKSRVAPVKSVTMPPFLQS